mgnify:CR=1 FL=1
MASSRIIVQSEIAKRFIPAFVEIAKGVKIGDLSDPETAIGPIISGRNSASRWVGRRIGDWAFGQ